METFVAPLVMVSSGTGPNDLVALSSAPVPIKQFLGP